MSLHRNRATGTGTERRSTCPFTGAEQPEPEPSDGKHVCSPEPSNRNLATVNMCVHRNPATVTASLHWNRATVTGTEQRWTRPFPGTERRPGLPPAAGRLVLLFALASSFQPGNFGWSRSQVKTGAQACWTPASHRIPRRLDTDLSLGGLETRSEQWTDFPGVRTHVTPLCILGSHFRNGLLGAGSKRRCAVTFLVYQKPRKVSRRFAYLKLWNKYRISNIPSLIFLDATTGKVVCRNGLLVIRDDPEGKTSARACGPLITQPLLPLPSSPSHGRDGVCQKKPCSEGRAGTALVSVACPPCRSLTRVLVESYRKIKEAGQSFEIIFVSADRSVVPTIELTKDLAFGVPLPPGLVGITGFQNGLRAVQGLEQTREQPEVAGGRRQPGAGRWGPTQHPTLGHTRAVRGAYGGSRGPTPGHTQQRLWFTPHPLFPSGIPTLIVLDPQGEVITRQGRVEVLNDEDCREFPWHPKPVLELSDSNATQLNEGPCLVLFVDSEDDGESEAAKQLIQPIAEKIIAKYKAKEEEAPLLFFVAGEDDMTDSLRDYTNLPEAAPLLTILDMSARAKYVMDVEEITPAIVEAFVNDFLAEKLKPEPI
ncbi:PREDICTED: nucleoredoxin [Colobus angolensis palliatus]|uniref:nucleoredoxin n=1 Tax=Colobus angolensis palliatus TaxID=336983 RepID=UPI0005F4C1CE|nr:PREDICTED: nucleoredoxin [Colobus angolensis palliatus]